MSHSLTIEYGEDVLFSTGLTVEQFSDEARFLLAAKLYDISNLFSGQAAQRSQYTASVGDSNCG
jgi:hypothetical protein